MHLTIQIISPSPLPPWGLGLTWLCHTTIERISVFFHSRQSCGENEEPFHNCQKRHCQNCFEEKTCTVSYKVSTSLVLVKDEPMGLYSERLQGVLVCSSFFLSSIYLCQAAFSFHSPATYISHSCRCKERWAVWIEDNLQSRTSLAKLQPVVHGVLLEGGVRQAQAFKWPAGEPLIWAPFSCVEEGKSQNGVWKRGGGGGDVPSRETYRLSSGPWSRDGVFIGFCEGKESHEPFLYMGIQMVHSFTG